MVVGELAEEADVLVIGGGSGGYVSALRAAALGRQVTLVERQGGAARLGGTCLHVGCIPSKALIELAHVRNTLSTFSTRGLHVHGVTIDLSEFQSFKSAMIERLRAGVSDLLKHAGVRVIDGHARITPTRKVAVEYEDRTPGFFEFRDLVLATGSRNTDVPVLPLDGHRIVDSTGVLALQKIPANVVVVGAGYIGLEMASALLGLGATVTVVERAGRILPGSDAAVSKTLHTALARRGIAFHTGTEVLGDDGEKVAIRTGDAEDKIVADLVVVAVGRRPNSEGLGLEHLDVTVDDRGFVVTGADQIAAPHVAAIGDLTAGPALAHRAMAQGVVAAEALCGKPAQFDPAAIPAIVYTDPEVAMAGLSDDQLAGRDVVVSRLPMGAIARSATLGHGDGQARLLSERGTGVLLGAQLIGPNVSEVIGEIVLALEMGATVEDLASTVHAHPTISEAILETAAMANGTPLHAR